MNIVIRGWPTMSKDLSAKMRAWLGEVYPHAAIVDGDEPGEPFAYAGMIIIVSTEDTRTKEDIERGAT